VLALLVHSPLVGPSTLQLLAQQLEVLGWTADVPDLRNAIGSPQDFVAAARAVELAELLVGHSGAGAFLPLIAHETHARATVFVDAVLPTFDGPYVPSKHFAALLERLEVTDGLLPPWNEWWTPEVMARLVPDDALRRRIVDEIVRVPRSFYDASIDLPPRWHSRPAGYLQLSSAYNAEATRAHHWGWPTARIDGQHLDVTIRPELVARHIDELARLLLSAPTAKPSGAE
jgi:hypothetical protein